MKHLLFRILYAVLISTLAIGSVSPTSTVQAAPPAERVYFSMEVVNPKTRIFCKETVTYLVRVELAQSNGAPTPAPGSFGFSKGLAMVNMTVEAFSVDKRVGDFVGTEKGTATAKTGVAFKDDLAALTGAAKFRFTANKPGKTTLYFQGLVGKEYVSAELVVEVLPCRFKTTTISEWQPSLEGNPVIMATSGDAEVKADEQGNFTGAATVNWTVNVSQIGDCVQEHTIGGSQVEWSGQMDDAGQLALNGNYQPASGSVTVFCGETWTFPEQLTPDLVQASVSSYGGVSRQSQLIELEGVTGTETHPGTVTIIVVPDEEEAVSFIPGNHEPRWNDPLSLFSALLALY